MEHIPFETPQPSVLFNNSTESTNEKKKSLGPKEFTTSLLRAIDIIPGITGFRFLAKVIMDPKTSRIANKVNQIILKKPSDFLSKKVSQASGEIIHQISAIKTQVNQWKENKHVKFITDTNRLERLFDRKADILEDPDHISNRPVGGPVSLSHINQGMGNLNFTTSLVGGIFEAIGVVGTVLQIEAAVSMLKEGLNQAKGEGAIVDKAHQDYSKSLIQKATTSLITESFSLVAGAAANMRVVANLVLQASHGTVASIGMTVAATGTLIAAPITFCLCLFGLKRNITRIRRSTAFLNVVNLELERLQETKQNLGVTHFTNQKDRNGVELKEREEILIFAKRKLEDQRIDHIVGAVSNSLIMIGSAFTVTSVAMGPGVAIMGTIGIVFVAIGAGGSILTRGILTALRHHRKTKAKELSRRDEWAPHYYTSDKMMKKAEQILQVDNQNHVQYNLDKPPEKWSNGELLAFFLVREPLDSDHFHKEPIADDTRRAFLVGQNHYWKKAFA